MRLQESAAPTPSLTSPGQALTPARGRNAVKRLSGTGGTVEDGDVVSRRQRSSPTSAARGALADMDEQIADDNDTRNMPNYVADDVGEDATGNAVRFRHLKQVMASVFGGVDVRALFSIVHF